MSNAALNETIVNGVLRQETVGVVYLSLGGRYITLSGGFALADNGRTFAFGEEAAKRWLRKAVG